jgi:hypothetical protein
MPYLEENSLKLYLSRLAITLEVHAINTHRLSTEGDDVQSVPTRTKDLLYSATMKDTDDPLIIVSDAEDRGNEGDGRHVLAIWKMQVFIGR